MQIGGFCALCKVADTLLRTRLLNYSVPYALRKEPAVIADIQLRHRTNCFLVVLVIEVNFYVLFNLNFLPKRGQRYLER